VRILPYDNLQIMAHRIVIYVTIQVTQHANEVYPKSSNMSRKHLPYDALEIMALNVVIYVMTHVTQNVNKVCPERSCHSFESTVFIEN